MKTQLSQLLLILLLFITAEGKTQVYPVFGPEINVTINGLTFDAMEPFLSADGTVLFFNNLNDGVNTRLYFATKVDDSTFNLAGEVNGTNRPTPPHLDAVPDMDLFGAFYWTSDRGYPADLYNLHHGTFSAGSVTNIGRVRGDFNKNIQGWLVMDHGISLDGQFLYYNNARFDGITPSPRETELGIAQKVNDSVFNKILNSDNILQTIISDTNYIYYAPCVSSDNLELYYTRYLKDSITTSTLFEICVVVRNTSTDVYSVPSVLFSEPIGDLIEAPTLTTDKKIMYYHRKIPTTHRIVMRYRDTTLNVENLTKNEVFFTVYPNPSSNDITIEYSNLSDGYSYTIVNALGEIVLEEQKISSEKHEVNTSNLNSGTYLIRFHENNRLVETIQFVKK